MGCNSSKATKTTENNIESGAQAAGENLQDQKPVFYTWGFSPFCRAVAMVAAELDIDLEHKVSHTTVTVMLVTSFIC